MKKIIIFLCFVLFAFGSLTFPKLSGRVVDEAGILSKKTKIRLERLLKSAENNSTNQIVIVTLKSLQGSDIAEYGYQLGRYWGIGEKKLNNGVLLIVAPNERKVRIEVGYGLEGKLTDAMSSVIINSDILPFFKKGDYDGGVINGTKAILSVLKGTYKKNSKKLKKDNFAPLIFFVFIFFTVFVQSIFSNRYKKIVSKIIPSSFIGFFAYAFTTSLIIGIMIFILAFILFFISNAFSNNVNSSSTFVGTEDDFFTNNGNDFGGFDGGFSGGGGSFGGGGASGSW